MNITIKINDKEIKVTNDEVKENAKVQEVKEVIKKNQIVVSRNKLTKLPNSKFPAIEVEEFELANYLLGIGYLIKEIKPANEGFVFLFYPGHMILRTIEKWNKSINTLDNVAEPVPEVEVGEDGK